MPSSEIRFNEDEEKSDFSDEFERGFSLIEKPIDLPLPPEKNSKGKKG